jgi:hypothetical protein
MQNESCTSSWAEVMTPALEKGADLTICGCLTFDFILMRFDVLSLSPLLHFSEAVPSWIPTISPGGVYLPTPSQLVEFLRKYKPDDL